MTIEDNERELELEMKDVDMSGYSNEMWFNEIYEYLENIFTPKQPKSPESLARQNALVKKKIQDEFDKRFPELLIRDLF